jgi:hypothetical protein
MVEISYVLPLGLSSLLLLNNGSKYSTEVLHKGKPMNTEILILNRGFNKLASTPLVGGLSASKPLASRSASEQLKSRLMNMPNVPPAPTVMDRAAPTVNKALGSALSAYKMKGKYTGSEGSAMPGKYKGISFKGSF